MTTTTTLASLVDPDGRFWTRVNRGADDQCWEWFGANTGRYGILHVEGVKHVAHRVAWAIAHGGWPTTDLCVCHRCDNPRCVNPSHLFLGSASDNMRDAANKGRLRGVVGENAVKAECKRGHPLPPPNKRGIRECLVCRTMHDRAFKSRRRAHALLPKEPTHA